MEGFVKAGLKHGFRMATDVLKSLIEEGLSSDAPAAASAGAAPPAPAAAAARPAAPAPPLPKVTSFAHPGTLMGAREVELLKRRVASGEQPPCPLAEVVIQYDGVGQGHDEFVERDGKVVYMQAVAWLATGEAQYAHNAAYIIWAWSSVNKVFVGQNGPLEAGWGVASMARSAELLKYTWPGWHPKVETAFLSWVDRVIMPNLKSNSLNHLPLGNWHTTVAEAKAQLAIFKGDTALFAEALSDWQRVIDSYLQPCGECSETKRDLYHSQFGLGGLVQVAELAWQQGVDLYSHADCRLAAALEFHALITNGGVPPQCTYPLRGIGFLPCGWEVALNHYKGRWGMSMPETEKLLARSRPEGYVFHWGLGTLTHCGSAAALPPAAGAPAAPPAARRR
ncbi:hypothetical protein Rsub_10491 [Raphidocelis subcapitata]|uniref:Alginate lyase domain-containing protein n=1 Tax=Raphidocelis subcapitata TaxID=307507 RepID=A0A2V0PF15_9CHLO|nr:hypothetical protein Rsub_10491 [Raphidocelis subcapitata]|eukprot:GBF98426.1 hypothetical protein Rsub_10491 [Raphidocelis subcapitata]